MKSVFTFKSFWICLLYCLSAVYGSFWISNEFNEVRKLIYGYIAIPVAVLFFSFSAFNPFFWAKRQAQYIKALLLIFSFFLLENVLLINALTGSQSITYGTVFKTDHNDRTLNLSYKKGGLGFRYQTRW